MVVGLMTVSILLRDVPILSEDLTGQPHLTSSLRQLSISNSYISGAYTPLVKLYEKMHPTLRVRC